LLSAPRLERDGVPLAFDTRKNIALVAYLAVTNESYTREALITLLWPELEPSRARANLRRNLSVLKKALGEEWLVVDRETVGPDPTADLWLDVEQFRRLLRDWQAHGHPENEVCPECLTALAEAVELYRGDFLAGFSLRDSPNFDEWQFFQTEGLRGELAPALERLVQGYGAQEAYSSAIPYARRWLALDPLHEPAHRHLMRLYAQAGRRSAALRQYAECERVLGEELAVPPAAETTALYERIRVERSRPEAREVPAPAPTPPPAPPPFITEEKALAEIERPVFVARERELARLDGLLQGVLGGKAAVVFVTGGPGRGKTALMDAFARRAMDAHPDLLVASGHCSAYSGAGDPYLPFRHVMGMFSGDVAARWAAGAVSRAHATRLWQALPRAAQALVDHGPELVDTFIPGPALLSRARAAVSDADLVGRLQALVERERAGPGEMEQSQLFEQLSQVLRSLAADHPLLLLLDDLQWADSASISLLFHLGRELADAGVPILIVGAYRPEEVALGRGGGF
jgi:DNA-binding SARP family transcriptional activator/ABC-type transporter Mla MlaB component